MSIKKYTVLLPGEYTKIEVDDNKIHMSLYSSKHRFISVLGNRKFRRYYYDNAINKSDFSWLQVKRELVYEVKKKPKPPKIKKNERNIDKYRTKDGYKLYLRTKHWKKFRKRAIVFLGSKCRKCGTRDNLNVHHLNYNCLFKETMKDVEILCKCCHSEEHGLYDQEEGEVDKEFAQLIKGF